MNLKTLLLSLLLLLMLTTPIMIGHQIITAQTSQDISKEIEEKEKELSETNKQIEDLENQILEGTTFIENAESGIPKLEAEIAQIEFQLELNIVKSEQIKQVLELKILEKNVRLKKQKKALKTSYFDWRLNNSPLDSLTGESFDFFKTGIYSSYVLGVERDDLSVLTSEIRDINSDLNEYGILLEILAQETNELENKKAMLESQINYYSNLVASNSDQVGNLGQVRVSLEGQISNLQAEQQAAAKREAEILQASIDKARAQKPPVVIQDPENPDNTIEKPSVGPKFIVSGKGRDMYQGHGVGYSQFGAYGGAQSGMTAAQLIQFYFQGVELATRTGTITLLDQGITLDVEEYLKHLGEVPDKACGNESQVNANPKKYALYDPNTLWKCWPEEAIKSQVIIARTYALFHKNIYSDARSQVYNIAYDKSWAAEETRGQVILYNGAFIDAVYSSDNNQGNGTANNDTIFQNIFGDGTPLPYLRSVNDTAFALQSSWTNWTYQTFDYSYSDIVEMLTFIADSPNSGYDAGTRANIKSILTDIGNSVQSIELERDPSQRIKKVWLVGSNGAKRSIGGWWFKNMWNEWAYEIQTFDYIYSTTFYLN